MPDALRSLPPVVVGIIAALVVAFLCFSCLLFLAVYGPRARFQRRLNAVVGASTDGGKRSKASTDRRLNVEAKLREIERLKNSKRGYKLNEELMQAGLAISPRTFVIVSVALGIVLSLIYVFFKLPLIGLPAVAIIGMLGLPKLYLRTKVNRRIKKFTSLFADAIDILIRGVRTGLTVGECLAIVGREMPDPVGLEFRLVTEGIQLGLTTEDCLAKLYRRVPTAEIRFFSIVLVMQKSTGGNLAETLEKLTDVIRSRKRMRDKIQALSSEAKTSAGIVGSLPVFVAMALSVLSPEYVGLLFTTDTGNWLILIGLIWMAIGVFVMAKIIHFDY
ncbi:MAG TPA: type II secretion system F family protein [Dongiaceae bacterium]|nr:type II secretion system F family protein [Dongiaceae bacterium]